MFTYFGSYSLGNFFIGTVHCGTVPSIGIPQYRYLKKSNIPLLEITLQLHSWGREC